MVDTRKDNEKRLKAGLKALEKHRDGKGRWKRFPFYYTLLAISELDFKSAIAEMKYAAPVLERVIKRNSKKDKYAERRVSLAERILEKI